MINHSFKIISLLFVLLITACNNETCQDADVSPISYSFFIAGHTYGAPGVDNEGVHPPLKNKFDFIKNDPTIEFGVFTGDIVPTGTEQNWNEIDADVNALGLPIHFAVGNHDMTDRDLYESRYGQTYFSFVNQSDLFIVLDPNIDNWNISGDQLQFLQDVLSSQFENVDNIFVFFHQLLWWEPDNIYQNIQMNSMAGRDDDINFWSEVEPLFNGISNQIFMFAGDVGAFNTGSEFMFHQYDNITLVASGMGGEARDNIVVIDVHEDQSICFRLIALNGSDDSVLGQLEEYELP